MKSEKSRFAARRLAWSICVSLLFGMLQGAALGRARDRPISLPGAGWELAVKRAAFTLSDDQSNSAGTSREMFFEHSDGRLSFTVSMHPTSVKLEEARAELLQSLQKEEAQLVDEREWERDDTLFLEYVTKDSKGTSVTKHVYAFLTADETIVRVHFVKMSFKQYQQKHLDALTESLEIVPGKGKDELSS